MIDAGTLSHMGHADRRSPRDPGGSFPREARTAMNKYVERIVPQVRSDVNASDDQAAVISAYLLAAFGALWDMRHPGATLDDFRTMLHELMDAAVNENQDLLI